MEIPDGSVGASIGDPFEGAGPFRTFPFGL